jgi:hypothetical protein
MENVVRGSCLRGGVIVSRVCLVVLSLIAVTTAFAQDAPTSRLDMVQKSGNGYTLQRPVVTTTESSPAGSARAV